MSQSDRIQYRKLATQLKISKFNPVFDSGNYTNFKSFGLVNNLKEQVDLIQDKLLRAIAESENTRHRMNKKVEEARDFSIVGFAKDLLPVIDNFSRALSHVPENINEETKIIIDGVRMIKDELISIFKKWFYRY